MESTKLLCIPQNHEPAKVVGFSVNVGDSVTKLAPVLIYEYKEKFQEGNESIGEDSALLKALKKAPDAAGYLTKREYLRSPFEGKVTNLLCGVGDDVQHSDALIEITMPCSHSAVFNGLCAFCGKDVSEIDSTGVPDTQARISMFHDNNDLKVSYDMAASIDADTRERLWGHEKLSLIIDLDMTIIHATAPLNPGFEHWLIENYDGPRALETNGSDGSNSTDGQPKPKHTTLPDDIGCFDLPVIPSRHFIKLRPGLREFLEKLSKMYEMHIYTMGSRPYADAVAKLIDPECKYFNGRILSRDENGSKDRKSLGRLFPVDTSMVVIIDDRADVWDWSPNLIRVHQYEFFTGVGDINAGHLPPVQGLGAEKPLQKETPREEQSPSDISSNKEPVDSPDNGKKDDDNNNDSDEEADTSLPIEGDVSPGSSTAVETTTPEPAELDDITGNRDAPANDAIVRADVEYSNSTEEGRPVRRPHLVDNDRELTTIQEVLVQLHKEYYMTLGPSHEPPLPDVARILSMRKGAVLNGASLAFTAVFLINPGSPPPQRTDIWIWAQNFGARCELEVSDRTTHVIAGKPGTEKVHAARKLSNKAKAQGGCSPIVVKKEWLLHSIYRWEWLDETPYLWFDDDKELAIRSAEARKSRRRYADSPVNKRKSSDIGNTFEHEDSGNKQKRMHRSTIERLKRQVDRATHEYDSANTTDIEDELERQEAGLEEHVAEIDDFVQNIDWDDLEREIMEDTDESDGNQSSSDSQPSSGTTNTRNPSHTPSAADLRQKAMKQAAKRRVSRGGTNVSGDEDDSRSTTKKNPSREGTNRRLSNLARADGSLDINTNTEEESSDDDNDSDNSAKATNTAKSKHESSTRGFWAGKIKMPAKKTILDEDLKKTNTEDKRKPGSNLDDNDDEFEDGHGDIDEPLFAGIEDKNGDYINVAEEDDDEEFVNATSREEGNEATGGYQSDGSENEDWGEDDDSDDDNFDDLINDLEEEISSS
ncbi:CTD phosphatase Fcp1 [Coemansia sp. RSA 1646]|nr:CTD phosphatase Fcp1 [Coemansia sp. RSA 1646]KAJ1768048.1 CTD phosphatase Fcp1 [Coemansia sp. RSA 1843]KAJ2211415.1 CTD phosphatase Fcp1 [Coemansia sp. RSA 487]